MTIDEQHKPAVLILGGIDFIGRHLVHYLITHQLTSYIRVADKMLPQTAYLSKQHEESFTQVDFKQANLINPASIASCFQRGDAQPEFDYVFNFAADCKYSQVNEIYQDRILNLSVNCANEAAKRHIKVYLMLSTAEVYGSDQVASKETSKIKPWTTIAKYKHLAEEQLKKIEGLNLIILRPAIVYGPGATTGLTPRLIIGRIYKYLNEEMTLLWSKDLKLNTVHVQDVVRACWHLVLWYKPSFKPTPVFNLADKQDTNQETINTHLRVIFDISTGYYGSVVSTFARLNLNSVVEDINEKHLEPWANILKSNQIQHSPLSPYLDPELLYNNAVSINGAAIEHLTGFRYSVPYLTHDHLQQIIDEFKEMELWP